MMNGTTLLGDFITSDGVIGAGGWATGIDEPASDGTLIIRCDTTHAHVRDPGATKWTRQMVPGVDLDPADIDLVSNPGGFTYNVNVYGAAIAYSNSAVRYIAGPMGHVWVKKPSATNYTKTVIARRTTIDGNSASRMCGQPVAVDPANPAHAIFMLPEGAFRTTDYGDTCPAIPTGTLPAPVGGIGIVCFDRSSAVVGGITQRIRVFIPGTGCYVSDDGGVTWAAMTAMPTSPTSAGHMKVHPTTGLTIVSGLNIEGDGPIRIWNGTAWSTGKRFDVPATDTTVKTIAFSGVANRIYGILASGGFRISTDNGATWSAEGGQSFAPADVDVPWHVEKFDDYLAIGDVVRMPGTESYVMSNGVGVFRADNPPTSITFSTQVPLKSISLGIENMVGANINYAPDGSCGITMQDKQSMLFAPGKVGRELPRKFGPVPAIRRGVNTDYALGNTSFWVTSFVPDTEGHLGFTEDRGETWTVRDQLRVLTSGPGGGQVCVLTENIWIAAQQASFPLAANAAKNAPYITRDKGLTWTQITIGNGNAVVAHHPSFNGAVRKVLIKDPHYASGNVRRVYFYNCADVDDPTSADSIACRGVWQIDVDIVATTAPTVTRKYDQRLYTINQDAIDTKMVVLGAAGKLGFCGGNNAPGAFRSNDGGATWAPFGGTDNLGRGDRFSETFGITAGKARRGSSHPTLYVDGYRNFSLFEANGGTDFDKYGLWASYDDGETWERAEQFPGGQILPAQDIGANPAVFGEVTITLPGMGALTRYYDYKLRAS